MFSGFQNQMSSIGSWIGSKKASVQSQETSPQNPEILEEKVVSDMVTSNPELNEANGVEQQQATAEPAKGDLFSSMKNQMSSWLSKKEPAKEGGDEEIPPKEVPKQLETNIENPTEAEMIEADKEGFGSGLEEVSNKAMQGARTIGSFFASAVSKAGKTVTEASAKIKKTVEETSILSEFNKEQEAFIKSKNKNMEGALAPWIGYPDEEALKAEILSLSTDRRNFVRSPPSGVQFQFDYETFYPIALATLAEDPNLETMRFELVPKIIKEELFWRNYFYRVGLIRQSTTLCSMAQEEGGNRPVSRGSSGDDDDDKTEEADTPDSPMHEFVSDSYQSHTMSKDLKEVQEGIKRLGTNKKTNDEDWEKELQAELQDFELGSEGSGKTDGPDGDDIEEMLDAEESHNDLK